MQSLLPKALLYCDKYYNRKIFMSLKNLDGIPRSLTKVIVDEAAAICWVHSYVSWMWICEQAKYGLARNEKYRHLKCTLGDQAK